MNQQYLDTARLLTQVAPLIFDDDTFALKGGTAINLFFRDMPRLSVDLDLVFVDHRPEREEALAIISEKIRDAAERLRHRHARIDHLILAGFAAQLRDRFNGLINAGRADRMTTRF